MKRILFFIAIIAMTGSVIFTSCQKDEPLDTKTNQEIRIKRNISFPTAEMQERYETLRAQGFDFERFIESSAFIDYSNSITSAMNTLNRVTYYGSSNWNEFSSTISSAFTAFQLEVEVGNVLMFADFEEATQMEIFDFIDYLIDADALNYGFCYRAAWIFDRYDYDTEDYYSGMQMAINKFNAVNNNGELLTIFYPFTDTYINYIENNLLPTTISNLESDDLFERKREIGLNINNILEENGCDFSVILNSDEFQQLRYVEYEIEDRYGVVYRESSPSIKAITTTISGHIEDINPREVFRWWMMQCLFNGDIDGAIQAYQWSICF